MSKTLIIGYGNPLRADDGAGWQAACRLDERLQDPDVTVLARRQLTPELAENLSRVDRVIFIDASTAHTPGTFAWKAIHPASASPEAFSHDCDPPALLALARALYGVSPQAFLLEIGAGDFGCGGRLSPVVEARMEEVVELVLGRVKE